jgi:lipoate-protein ligase B
VPRADYVGYLRRLEKSLIVALSSLGIAAAQLPRLTGVWVQPDVYSRCARCRPEDRRKPAKIAAIGVKVDVHGISRHGFALNVDPDMTYWEGIVACGLSDYPLVCLADLLEPVPTMDSVKAAVSNAFAEVFDTFTQ